MIVVQQDKLFSLGKWHGPKQILRIQWYLSHIFKPRLHGAWVTLRWTGARHGVTFNLAELFSGETNVGRNGLLSQSLPVQYPGSCDQAEAVPLQSSLLQVPVVVRRFLFQLSLQFEVFVSFRRPNDAAFGASSWKQTDLQITRLQNLGS